MYDGISPLYVRSSNVVLPIPLIVQAGATLTASGSMLISDSLTDCLCAVILAITGGLWQAPAHIECGTKPARDN